MDKLKKHFLKIHEDFKEKRPYFQKCIDRWKKMGRSSTHKQAKILLDEAIECEKEILSVFSSSDWKYNRPFLKVKINALDNLLKELNLLTKSVIWKWIEITVVVTAVVFVLRTFFFGIYLVPSSSAETTILVGDRVWGNKLVYFLQEPKIGDVVMFEDPLFKYDKNSFLQRLWQKNIGIKIERLGFKAGPQNMAKRVIGCPGDVIEGKIEKGKPVIYRNGKKVNEPYVNKYPLLAIRKQTGFISGDKIGPVDVPKAFKIRTKNVLYSYDPKKDFEEQPFYYIDYKNILYDKKNGYMKLYKSGIPATNKDGKPIDKFGPFIVPEGKYWVMGDNRRNSVDSRSWGFVDRKKISGKACLVIWSLDSEESLWLLEFIKNPFRFFASLRLRRFFKPIE